MKSNVPKLRFNGFSDEWEEKTLEELSEKIMVGIASSATHAYRNSGIIMFRNQNIKPNYLDVKNVLYIDQDYEKTHKNKRLMPGDLLTARTGYPGTTCVVPIECINSQSFTTLITRPDKKIALSNYLSQFINSDRGTKFFKAVEIGGGQKNVNAETLKSFPINIPNMKEQEKIAGFLTKVDSYIDKQEDKVKNLESYKKGMMQKIFSQEIRFKDEDGCDYPEWEEKNIGQIASLVKDGTHGTHTDVEIGPYLLSAKNIKGGKIVITKDDRKISYDEYNAIYKNYNLKKDDILLSIVGTIGRTAIVNDEEDIVFQRSVVILRFDNHDANYIHQFMTTREFQDSLIKNQVVSAQPGIYLNDLKRLILNIPCVKEQTKISNFLSNIDEIVEKEKQKLENLRIWKKGLLQQMFV